MICIYITALGMYGVLFILSWSEAERNPFRKMAAYLLRRQRKSRRDMARGPGNWEKDLSRRQLGDKLRILRPETAVQTQVQEYYLSQYSVMLGVVFSGIVICLAVWLGARSDPLLKEGNHIRRNSYGQGGLSIDLAAQVEGEEEIFRYVVEERQYTSAEAETLYQEVVKILPEIIRGENKSLEDVRHSLELVTGIEGYPFAISWESDSYALINTDGMVDNSELTNGEIVMLTAHFRYGEYTWDHQMHVQVNPVVYTYREALRKRIEELLHMQQEDTASKETMVLPENVGSKPIVWKEMIEDSSGSLLFLAILTAGALYWGRSREIDRRLERRKTELLMDYPEIVNKLSLYMGAGMTIRNAFVKMGEDYKKQRKERRRYVYEEILIMCYELQSGKSEREAYDRFGKRCQVQAYMKLSTLLSQNIRKGSNDLLHVLRQEADNAFVERKSLAKKLGEEAGTKLLLPMMMMLCIVMVIIMIPACFSFVM